MNAASDKYSHIEIEVHNNADSLLYASGKMLYEHSDKINSPDRKAIEDASFELRKVLGHNKPDEFTGDAEMLTRAIHSFSEALYAATASTDHASSNAPPPEGESSAGGADHPQSGYEEQEEASVDADFAYVDDGPRN